MLNHLKVFWICLKVLASGKWPPMALWRWAHNLPTEADLVVARRRLAALKEKNGPLVG